MKPHPTLKGRVLRWAETTFVADLATSVDRVVRVYRGSRHEAHLTRHVISHSTSRRQAEHEALAR